MKISTFKFGNTPIYYTPDGAIARGILYPRQSAAQELAEWVLACSVALLIIGLALSTGRPAVTHVRYGAASALSYIMQSSVMRKLLPERTVGALWPFSLKHIESMSDPVY